MYIVISHIFTVMLCLLFTGGIDERVCTILTLCCEKKVQVVHAMSRKRLAFILKKKYMIGCVGIFSYDGAEVLSYACACTLVYCKHGPDRGVYVQVYYVHLLVRSVFVIFSRAEGLREHKQVYS